MGEPRVQVLSLASGPRLDIIEGAGSANAPVRPGIGARHRSVVRMTLAAGDRTVVLCHAGEAVYYVGAGAGSVDDGAGESSALVEGSMVHVDGGTDYRFTAGRDGMVILGGPCPPDPALTPVAG